MGINRRFMLQMAVAAFGLLPLLGRAPPVPSAMTRLRALVPQPRSAHRLGRAYLAHYPGEEGPGRLTRLILATLGLDEGAVAVRGEPELRAALATRIRDDFATAQTVMVDGWILSRTEMRLYALWA